ncbi:MAG: hypothetical protein CL484_16405 [Acidobacteria bacterium]|nr:hypothetical protein [Acidobacteriota bacterium]
MVSAFPQPPPEVLGPTTTRFLSSFSFTSTSKRTADKCKEEFSPRFSTAAYIVTRLFKEVGSSSLATSCRTETQVSRAKGNSALSLVVLTLTARAWVTYCPVGGSCGSVGLLGALAPLLSVFKSFHVSYWPPSLRGLWGGAGVLLPFASTGV